MPLCLIHFHIIYLVNYEVSTIKEIGFPSFGSSAHEEQGGASVIYKVRWGEYFEPFQNLYWREGNVRYQLSGGHHYRRGRAYHCGCTLVTHFMEPQEGRYSRGKIYIKKGAYLGAHTIVCKPVTIGQGAVVGAGSVVTKDIPDYEVWAGNPARFRKKIVRNHE